MEKRNLLKVLIPTGVATLAVSAVAFAASGDGSSGSSQQPNAAQTAPQANGQQLPAPQANGQQLPAPQGSDGQQLPAPPSGGEMPPPPGVAPDVQGELANGELNVVNDGTERTVGLDRGTIESLSPDEITIREATDEVVTIAVSDETQFLAAPGQTADASDLEQGDEVIVTRDGADGAARTIAVCPPQGQLQGPPAQQDAPQGAPQGVPGTGS